LRPGFSARHFQTHTNGDAKSHSQCDHANILRSFVLVIERRDCVFKRPLLQARGRPLSPEI